AAALAILVVLLLRCCGERLSPRWRFLLWGVVLTRLLFVATPVSPWSVFNLVPGNPQASARPIAQRPADAQFTPAPPKADSTTGRYEPTVESPQVADAAPVSSGAPVTAAAETPSVASGTAREVTPSIKGLFDA